MISPYSDGSAYDALVDNTCFPTCFDDGEDLKLTPATARALHFQTVAADRAAAARSTWDADTGTNGVGSQSRESLPHSSALGAGADAENVSGPGATHARPA